MEQRPHIFWIPCAAHCIDLMLMDIEKICRVQKIVESGQNITTFIYNHTWILSLIQQFAVGDILKPDVTRFATNYIALDSLIEKKLYLRQMFVSPEWQQNKYARIGTEGSNVESLVMRQSFWQRAEKIVVAIKPPYEVLQAMDGEQYPQMDFLYYMMERTKEQIKMVDPQHADEYIKIIDHR